MKHFISFYICFAICIAMFAQATDLTIDNQTPGWLSSKINYGDQETVRNLKVTGYVNVTDLRFIGSLTQDRNLHGCVDLSEVQVVGSKNNYIGNGTFNSNGTINLLILPKTLEELDGCLVTSSSSSSYSFLHVDTLVFAPENLKFVNGSFFSKRVSGGIIVGVPTHLIIGGAVDSIPGQPFITYSAVYEEGFRDHKGLTSVQLPPSIRYIGDCAFLDSDISDLNINELNNLEYLGACAFVSIKTSRLNSNYQPDSLILTSVKNFNASAFGYKKGQHLFFGEGLETISTGNGLNKSYGFGQNLIIHMKSKTPPTGHYPDNTCTVYVPKGAADAYKESAWGGFGYGNATIIEENPLERISITPQKIILEAGELQPLIPTFVPADADDKTLKWSSDDPAIATIDADGILSGVTSGITTIYATSLATGVKGSCEVTVIQHASDIQIDLSEMTLTKLGDTKQLNVIVLPENTTDKSVKWSSSNPSVCTVTASGKVVAMGYGEAVIMAVTNDGDLPATCVVKVVRPKHKLTYIVDGTEYQSNEYETGEAISLIAAPEKENYMFVGWSLTMPTDDVSLTAIYAPATSVGAIQPTSFSSFQVFTPDGIPMNTLQKGVNIIRYSDGQTKKVFIK